MAMSDPLLDLAEMLDSWFRRLRRDRKSDQTLRAYRRAVEAFLTFCDDAGMPRELTKPNVIAWLDAQHDCGTAIGAAAVDRGEVVRPLAGHRRRLRRRPDSG